MPDFGERLKQLRIRLGMTQTDLARQSGLGQSTISALETGRQRPWPSTMRALARAFGISPAQFAEVAGVGSTAVATADRPLDAPETPTAEDTTPATTFPTRVGPITASGEAFRFAPSKVMELLNELGRAEHELRQYRGFLDHVCAACWMTDGGLRLTATFGPVAAEHRQRHGDFAGRHVSEYFHRVWGGGDPGFLPLAMQQRAADGESVAYRWTLHGRVYDIFVDPTGEEPGKVTGTIALAVDVTDRDRADDQG